MFFIDAWSVGLDDIPRKQITPERILTILQREGRFSSFEASANPAIARAMTTLLDKKYGLLETYLPRATRGSWSQKARALRPSPVTPGPMSASPPPACASLVPTRQDLTTNRQLFYLTSL